MEQVAAIIRRSGLTHQQIAERSGLSYSLISKLASGQRDDVRVSTYERIRSAVDGPAPKRKAA